MDKVHSAMDLIAKGALERDDSEEEEDDQEGDDEDEDEEDEVRGPNNGLTGSLTPEMTGQRGGGAQRLRQRQRRESGTCAKRNQVKSLTTTALLDDKTIQGNNSSSKLV